MPIFLLTEPYPVILYRLLILYHPHREKGERQPDPPYVAKATLFPHCNRVWQCWPLLESWLCWSYFLYGYRAIYTQSHTLNPI